MYLVELSTYVLSQPDLFLEKDLFYFGVAIFYVNQLICDSAHSSGHQNYYYYKTVGDNFPGHHFIGENTLQPVVTASCL